MGDAGVTGRKIIVDTYGGMGRHGGGCLQRQGSHQGGSLRRVRRPLGGQERGCRRSRRPLRDPGGLRHWCGAPAQHQRGDLRHRQGGRREDRKAISQVFDLRPGAIIHDLDLRRPIYRKTAAYGHFGRDDIEFSWEKTNKVKDLQTAAGV